MDSIKIETWFKQRQALNYVIERYNLPPHIERVLEDMYCSIEQEEIRYKERRNKTCH